MQLFSCIIILIKFDDFFLLKLFNTLIMFKFLYYYIVSGRSSTYGDRDGERGTTGPRSETSSFGIPSGSMQHYVEGPETDAEYITSRK